MMTEINTSSVTGPNSVMFIHPRELQLVESGECQSTNISESHVLNDLELYSLNDAGTFVPYEIIVGISGHTHRMRWNTSCFH